MKAKEISKQIETKLKKLEFKDYNGETKYNDGAIEIKGGNFCYQIGNPDHAQEVIKRMSKINEDKIPSYNVLRQDRCKAMQKFYALCLGLSDYSKKTFFELMKNEGNFIHYLTNSEFETIFNEVKQLKTKPMKKEVKEIAKAENDQKIMIVSYSEKAVAVFGETRPLKELLKEQGGRFNPYLKKDGENCPGWIFSKKREAQLREVLKVS